jgi:lipoprotein-anchoring transpeptidase ErfK/SrfK
MHHDFSRPATVLSAGIGAALLMAAATPITANAFDYRYSATPYYRSAPVQSTQRTAFRSRGGGENRKEEAKDRGAADEILAKGKGPWSVFVSIDKQHLTLYSGDKPVAHTKVSTGTASHPTPTGVFSIIQRNRWHRSNLYGNAPMWFMQRITWSGVAMHQGHVTGQPASHGCIRLPEAFARQLWGITKMGNRVIVTRGEIAPKAFSDPKLFVFKRAPEPKQPEPAEPAVANLPSADETVRSASIPWNRRRTPRRSPGCGWSPPTPATRIRRWRLPPSR